MKRILLLVFITCISSLFYSGQIAAHQYDGLQSDDNVQKSDVKAYIYQEDEVNEMLIKSVGNLLANNYFTVVSDIEQANVWVKLKCDVNKGEVIRGEMYNFNEYFTTVEIQIENAKTSQILFDYTNLNYRTLSPVSTSATSAHNTAVREIMRTVEKDLKKKLKIELPKINQSVAQSRSTKTSKSMAAIKSAISLNDSYYSHHNKPKLSEQEQERLKVDQISCNSVVFQDRNFAKGVTVFQNESGRLESVLYIGEQSVYEYLVSFDASGRYIDCMEIGYVMNNADTKMSAFIEGDKITLISTHSANNIYQITPGLMFVK